MGDTSILAMIAALTRALNHAPSEMTNNLYNNYPEKAKYELLNEIKTTCLVQTDSNTSCGWGGIAGQAFTNFWMIDIEYPNIEAAAIFIGRIAYICTIDEEFKEALKNEKMPFWGNCSQSKLKILWKPTR